MPKVRMSFRGQMPQARVAVAVSEKKKEDDAEITRIFGKDLQTRNG